MPPKKISNALFFSQTEGIREKLKILFRHPGVRRYGFNTSWLLGEKVFRIIAALVVGIWVARYLGPEQFGVFSYSMAFAGLFSSLSGLGLDSIIVRELVKDRSLRNELLGTALTLKAAVSVSVLAAVFILIRYLSDNHTSSVLILILTASVFFKSFNVFEFYFQSETVSRYTVYSNLISMTADSAFKIWLILTAKPLVWFAWAFFAEMVILAAGLIIFYIKRVYPEGLHFRFNAARAVILLKDSWPLLLSGIVISVYMRVDQIMIQYMTGSEATGSYAAAVRISEAWYFIPVIITGSLFPAVLNAKQNDPAQYKNRLQRLFSLLTAISFSVAVFVSVFSETIILLLYGAPFLAASTILIVHIWAGVFVSFGVASGSWYVAENLQHLTFWRSLAGLILNILLNYLLIPLYGAVGAAWATLAAQALAGYFFDLASKRTRFIFLQKSGSFLLAGIV